MGSLLEFSKKDGLAGDKVAVADLGEGPGGGCPSLFLDQKEARRAKKFILGVGTIPPPPILSQGLDDRGPSLI